MGQNMIAAFLFQRKVCARNVLRISWCGDMCYHIMGQTFGIFFTASYARLFIHLTVSLGLFPENLASTKGLLASC